MKFKAEKFQKDLRQAFVNLEEYADPCNAALNVRNSVFLRIADNMHLGGLELSKLINNLGYLTRLRNSAIIEIT